MFPSLGRVAAGAVSAGGLPEVAVQPLPASSLLLAAASKVATAAQQLPADIVRVLGTGSRAQVASLARIGTPVAAIARELGLTVVHVGVLLGDGLVAGLAASSWQEPTTEEEGSAAVGSARGSQYGSTAAKAVLLDVDQNAEHLAAALQKQTLASLGRDLHNGFLRPTDKIGLLAQVSKARTGLARVTSEPTVTAAAVAAAVTQNFLTIQMPSILVMGARNQVASLGSADGTVGQTLVPAAPLMLKQLLGGANGNNAAELVKLTTKDRYVKRNENNELDQHRVEGEDGQRGDFWASLPA